jgi:CBS-domain-containing membrane protein
VFGGHLVSAAVGIACTKLIADPRFAGPLAVGLAIGAMHYLRCIHPPGGATALSAVVGGEAVHRLGFLYLFTPVLLNATVILLVALVFNYPFPWRRYPTALAQHTSGTAPNPGRSPVTAERSHGR